MPPLVSVRLPPVRVRLPPGPAVMRSRELNDLAELMVPEPVNWALVVELEAALVGFTNEPE